MAATAPEPYRSMILSNPSAAADTASDHRTSVIVWSSPDVWPDDPIGTLELLVGKTSYVAHPGVVYVVIATWHNPPDVVLILIDDYVAAVGAAWTDACGLGQEPNADSMMKVLCFKRTDRTDIRRAHRVSIVEAAVRNIEY